MQRNNIQNLIWNFKNFKPLYWVWRATLQMAQDLQELNLNKIKMGNFQLWSQTKPELRC